MKKTIGIQIEEELYEILNNAAKVIGKFEARKVTLSEIVRKALIRVWIEIPKEQHEKDALQELDAELRRLYKIHPKVEVKKSIENSLLTNVE